MTKAINSHKDLIVWQKSMDVVAEIYRITDSFPEPELYGLTSQMRRSAVLIPSNIVEGRKRSSRKDFRHFLVISCGSGVELETQIEISKRLNFVNIENYKKVDELLLEVMKMLNKMLSNLKVH